MNLSKLHFVHMFKNSGTVDPLISEHHGTGGCSDMQNVWICKIEIFIKIEWISYIQDTSLHDNVTFLRFKSHLSEFWTSFFHC